MAAVISARELTKRYGALTAVDRVSFEVAEGEIFGMLGPNGAGKTTTLEMLEGLTEPDGGAATVLGADVVREARRLKTRIGVQLQSTALPQLTRVREALQLFGALYPQARGVDELLVEFGLEEKADTFCDKLSGGQMQRLSIALALINNPDLVFLDEPTTGLDPQARINLWGVIEGVRAGGRTVMLTTHYMEEAERLCDRVAVMDHGAIVALATPGKLIAEYARGTTIEFEAPAAVDAAALRRIEGVDSVQVNGGVTVSTERPEMVLRALLSPRPEWLAGGGEDAEAGPAVRDLRVRSGTLEDVFLALTGRSLRDA